LRSDQKTNRVSDVRARPFEIRFHVCLSFQLGSVRGSRTVVDLFIRLAQPSQS